MTAFLARRQRFEMVGSTNDVVRGWLADGIPEVCLAVADEQTAGRGRAGRRWLAPRGAALLLSLGFRPSWLPPERVWRLAAVTALAMADAAEGLAELPHGAIRLKWPNDLVMESGPAGDESRALTRGPRLPGHDRDASTARKLAGLLGETDGLGTTDPRVTVGLGINAGWRAEAFPPELAKSMTSLYEASHGRPIDPAHLLDAFLSRLEARVEALRAGRFDAAGWQDRQLTTGRVVDLEAADGSETVRAKGVDVDPGALIVDDPTSPDGERRVIVGEVVHVRLATSAGALV
jgi:BirA family biotin operon repressor/biotin-[acetyl-CoA-carboxylase] ligase